VLVTADGPIVALGASTSGGAKGLASYGSAVGVPVPMDPLGLRPVRFAPVSSDAVQPYP